MRAGPRRAFRSSLIRISLFILAIWTFFETFHIHRIIQESNNTPVNRVNTEKVFIASLPWNNEIIFRTHLTRQIKDVVHALGIPNVYISIYENGSYDNTKGALRDLHRELEQLGVRSRLVLEETSHEDIVKSRPTSPKEGWIKIDHSGYEEFGVNRGDYAMRRIYYLAELRNKVLEPLAELAAQGEYFDKILFLNDVVFSADDVLKLLQTRDGKYAAACTLDFESPPEFYDTFALRDSNGHPALMQTWPFFHSSASRNAILANEPVPVKSCWNGIVAMQAAPFYDKTSPLRFRGVPDTLAHHHVEGSECCLIHADNRLSPTLGNWINPAVRVGYCHADLHKATAKITPSWENFQRVCQMAYDAVHPATGSWVGHWRIAWGLWENRARRVVGSWNWGVGRRVEEWRGEGQGREEVGEMCLIDEMHVIQPQGWLHV